MEAKKVKTPVRAALGRGLSALISTPAVPVNMPSVSAAVPSIIPEITERSPYSNVVSIDQRPIQTLVTSAGVNYVSIDQIKNNPLQPRQDFGEAEISDLSESIKTLGVLQPILVRPLVDGGVWDSKSDFEIVAGERRWRAAKKAGLTEVPVIIKQLDVRAALEIAIVENVQRENLNPIEEALAYQRLANEFQLSHEQIAERVGKDRASVSNYLRLLKLPAEVLDLIRSGDLSIGHAKSILSIREPSAQLSLARKVIKEALSVRALEAIVAQAVVLDAGKRSAAHTPVLEQPQASRYIESGNLQAAIDRMRNSLGTKVTIKHHKSGRGRVEIEYFSESELDRVIEHICR